MSDMEPITLKFKLADPEQVTDLITDAVLTSFWASGLSREWACEFVRDIHLALTNAGCLVIQLDNPSPSLNPPDARTSPHSPPRGLEPTPQHDDKADR